MAFDIMKFLMSQFPDLIPVYQTNPGFVPTYEPAQFAFGIDMIPRQLTETQFATRETAQWMASKFGADHIAQVPWIGSGGPIKSDAKQWFLVWSDGFAQCAGDLAKVYTQNQKSSAKDVENMVWGEIAKARAMRPLPVLPVVGAQ